MLTFGIIKPNAVAAGHTGKILDLLISEGFEVKALRMAFLSRNDAAKFYAVHRGKPFFERLITFMTSGAIVAMVLERDDAVAALRKLVGDTDPAKAAKGTLRQLYGETLSKNAIHASDSEQNANEEMAHFFLDEEIMDIPYSNPVLPD